MENKGTKANAALPAIDSLWNYSDPHASAEKFRALVPAAAELDDKSYLAELMTQLARSQSLQLKFNEAHAALDTAESLLTDTMVIPRIRYHLERGRSFNSAKRKAEASEQFLLAFDLALENGHDYYTVDAAHMLGISEEAGKQLEWNHRAMELAEQSDDERVKGWLGPLYNNNGWSYHDLGQFDKALELFEKSLEWRLARQDKKGSFIARWTIGRVYRSLNRIEEALAVQHDLLSQIEAGTAEADGYVYEELAECLLLQEKAEEAKPYFRRAHELLAQDTWMQNNEAERLARLATLGQ